MKEYDLKETRNFFDAKKFPCCPKCENEKLKITIENGSLFVHPITDLVWIFFECPSCNQRYCAAYRLCNFIEYEEIEI